jgi:hypothetical protein
MTDTVRFLFAWILAFGLWFGGAYVINGKLIDYSQIYQLFRPWDEELKHFPELVLADLLTTGAFVGLYDRLVRRVPGAQTWWQRGVQLGLVLIPVTVVPMYLRAWVASPIPNKMLVTQLVGFGVLVLLIGVVIAGVYRKAKVAYV